MPMRVFKSKWFVRFARNERISDKSLREAAMDAENGKIDTDYGGGVIKQRITRLNEGKSGGYRAIVLFRRGERAFFVYGFAKNERDNIDRSDERDFKALAKVLFGSSGAQMERLIANGNSVEVKNDAQD